MANNTVSVQLLERIANVGKEGEIIEVSHAYARNFLIAKKLARLATPELIKREAEKKKKAQDNKSHLIEARHEIAKKLHGMILTFELAGSKDKIFGGIGEHEIIVEIKKHYGVELEKKHILLPEGHHLKKVGVTDIKINLGSDVNIKMHIEIKSK
ncbi:MAG: 50S ribosomal protein L9 [Candidatus Gracilibacteria bacterium]|nr:50S ribosomal protein L9 [Candidatus Gracilibacteria bacterium]